MYLRFVSYYTDCKRNYSLILAYMWEGKIVLLKFYTLNSKFLVHTHNVVSRECLNCIILQIGLTRTTWRFPWTTRTTKEL